MKTTICLLLILFVAAAVSFQVAEAGLAPAGMDQAPADSVTDPAQGNGDISLAARYTVSAAIGLDRQAYHLAETEGRLRGSNPAQSYEMGFSRTGVEVGAGVHRWALSLFSWGYGADQHPVKPALPTATGNRVEYNRGALTEWYVNGPLGLQQGFTLAKAPQGERLAGADLRLCLNLGGGLTARVDPDRRGLSVYGAGGVAVCRYAGLTVLDANGREARAWLEVDESRLSIVVDDRNLNYPLVIDPFIQKAKLTASDGAVYDEFGYSVSVSGDTVVVGADCDDGWQGSAYVFVKPSGGWSTTSTYTAKLTASDGAVNDAFGYSVSVSGDTVVVGADCDDSWQGSAYVFVKPSGGWSSMTQTAKLTASDGTADDYFGDSVSVSGDTVVVGAYGDDSWQGSAYVFVKPSGGWATTSAYTAKLTASDGAASDRFGCSVSVSGDTVVVGAYGDDGRKGSAYVFVKPVGGWSIMTQTAKLTASDGAADNFFGVSVSISGDTVVVGAPGDNSDQGSAYVFIKPGADWVDMTYTAKLTASDGAAGDRFGPTVSISGDTVVVGADCDDSWQGSAYVFVKPSGGWSTTSTYTAKLTASDGAVNDAFGYSVSVSGDTVVVGAYGDDTSRGSAYVFDPKRNTGLGPLGLLLLD